MTFPIINILLLAENADSGNLSALAVVLICTAIFIASSVISGIAAFKIRSKKSGRSSQRDGSDIEDGKL